mgnify:CR=1 FL=1
MIESALFSKRAASGINACKTAAVDQFFLEIRTADFGFRNWVDTNTSPPPAIRFPLRIIESLICLPLFAIKST